MLAMPSLSAGAQGLHAGKAAEHDFVWDEIPASRETGAFLGNGMIGASVWAAPGETLRWSLGRNDIYTTGDKVASRVLIGKLLMKTKGKPLRGKIRQALYTAEVAAEVTTGTGRVRSRSIIPHDQMVGLVEFVVEGDETVEIVFRQLPCILPGVLRTAIAERGPELIDGWKKHPVRDFSDPRYEPVVQELLKDKKAAPHPAARRGAEKGVNWVIQPYASGGGFVVAWALQPAGQNRYLLAYTLEPALQGAPDPSDAVKRVRDALAEGFEAIRARHARWWENYYARSYVSLPDRIIEGYYWRQLYKLGSATRSDGVVLDELGPWPGASAWVRVWNNLNIQIAYLCPLTANRLELCDPFVRLFNSNHEKLRAAVPEQWHANGAMALGRMQDIYGNTRWGHEFGNLPWALHDYWLYCRYSGNQELMRQSLYPLLKGSANFMMNALSRREDGLYHFPKDTSPEYPGAKVEDSHYAISTLMWNLKTLQHLNQAFRLQDADADKWSEILENLSPLPVNETGLMVGSDREFAEGHRHYSHLLAFFPLRVMDPSSPEGKALFQKSVDHWVSLFPKGQNFFSISGEAAMRAWLRDGEKAAQVLDYGIPNKLTPNTHFAGAGVAVESALSGMWSVGEMLLQSWTFDPSEYCIRVLPAIPESWKDVHFENLRAEGAFLVSAERKDGVLRTVRIKSEAGNPVRVEVPFDRAFTLLIDGVEHAVNTTVGPEDTRVFVLNMDKGQTAIMQAGK
jgi:hypothetical protein